MPFWGGSDLDGSMASYMMNTSAAGAASRRIRRLIVP